MHTGSNDKQSTAISNLFARGHPGATAVRYTMKRSHKQWVAETLETPSWAVSLAGQRLQPRPAEEQHVRPQRLVATPPAPPEYQAGEQEGAAPVVARWSATPPRTPSPGMRWVPKLGDKQQPLHDVEPDPEIHIESPVAVMRLAAKDAAPQVGRQHLETPTWPPPLPSAPAYADVAQKWHNTSGPVLQSPRAGMSPSPRGLRGPQAAGTMKHESLPCGARTSVPPGLHKRTLHTPRGRIPDDTLARAQAAEQQSPRSTWSSLPAPEHHLDETWAKDPNASSTSPFRHIGVIKDTLTGHQACMLCVHSTVLWICPASVSPVFVRLIVVCTFS
jgi:hypothetical protein